MRISNSHNFLLVKNIKEMHANRREKFTHELKILLLKIICNIYTIIKYNIYNYNICHISHVY